MRIQTEFSESTDFLIRKRFSIQQEEILVSAVWIKGGRTGFIFTDQGLYWNAKTTVDTAGVTTECQGIQKIKKESASEFQADVLYKKKNGESNRKYSYDDTNATPEFLQLKNWQDKFRINISDLDSSDAKILRRIFLDYIARGKFPYEYMDQTPLDSITFMAEGIRDFFQAKANGFKKSKPEENSEEDDTQYETDRRTQFFSSHGEVTDIRSYFSASLRKKTSSGTVLKNFMRYFADTVADLIYAAAIFIAVKPILVYKEAAKVLSEKTNLFQTIGSLILKFDSKTRNCLTEIEWDGAMINKIISKRSFIFGLLIFIFFLIKIIVICSSSKGAKKIFPLTVLLFVLPVSMLATNHFLIFFILISALYLLMQFSLNLDWINIGFKLPAFAILVVILYYLLHLFGYPNFVDYMGVILQMMGLKAPWL